MARRRTPGQARVIGRPFTAAEVEEMRYLIAGWDDERGHPHPSVARLEEIHAAAGRTRRFKVWPLDRVTDVERALAEEVAQ